MKSPKARRFVKGIISLFSIVSWFLAPVTSTGQSKSSSPNLEGTVWRAPDVNWGTALGPAVSYVFYAFEKDGKMISRAVSIQLSQVQAIGEFQDPMFNPFGDKNPYSMKLYTPPAGIAVVDVPGSYKTQGNKLYLDFPKSSVVATIDGDEMVGVVTNKLSQEKVEWKVRKLQPKDGQATLPSTNPSRDISKPSGTGDDAIAASYQLLRGTLVSNDDGTLRPANGYQWVNPNDPKDLRVKPIP